MNSTVPPCPSGVPGRALSRVGTVLACTRATVSPPDTSERMPTMAAINAIPPSSMLSIRGKWLLNLLFRPDGRRIRPRTEAQALTLWAF